MTTDPTPPRLTEELLDSIERLSHESEAVSRTTGQFLKIEKRLIRAMATEIQEWRAREKAETEKEHAMKRAFMGRET